MKTPWICGALAVASIALAQDTPAPFFDGKTLTGWTTVEGKPIEKGWDVVDGAIHRTERSEDIVTEKTYDSFDLSFEWKVKPGVNSGLKYHFGTYGKKNIGIEYQLIDAEKPGDNLGKHATGSLYDLFAPDPKAKPKPAGEWNQSRILVDGKKITHWLNGVKTVEVTIGSKAWNEALAKSKFKDAPNFGDKPGKILLQDHGGEVWLRNFQLKERKTP